MARSTQLKITWDGPLQSLSEKRVSLSAFGEPLSLLLAATKRIASNMVSTAIEPADVGRLAKEAHLIDIEIGSVLQASSGVDTVMTFYSPDGQQPLFNNLTENVGIALLDAIDAERMGELKNSGVRRYLQCLPVSLTRQVYDLHENGRQIKRIEFGTMQLPDAPRELPFLEEVMGRIIGVGFEPGRPEIRFRSEDGNQTTVPATAKQVESAIDHRTATVRALILRHGLKTRLMSMEDVSLPRFRADAETHIFKRWDNLLRRLAQ